jgi:hypothetical protein
MKPRAVLIAIYLKHAVGYAGLIFPLLLFASALITFAPFVENPFTFISQAVAIAVLCVMIVIVGFWRLVRSVMAQDVRRSPSKEPNQLQLLVFVLVLGVAIFFDCARLWPQIARDYQTSDFELTSKYKAEKAQCRRDYLFQNLCEVALMDLSGRTVATLHYGAFMSWEGDVPKVLASKSEPDLLTTDLGLDHLVERAAVIVTMVASELLLLWKVSRPIVSQALGRQKTPQAASPVSSTGPSAVVERIAERQAERQIRMAEARQTTASGKVTFGKRRPLSG